MVAQVLAVALLLMVSLSVHAGIKSSKSIPLLANTRLSETAARMRSKADTSNKTLLKSFKKISQKCGGQLRIGRRKWDRFYRKNLRSFQLSKYSEKTTLVDMVVLANVLVFLATRGRGKTTLLRRLMKSNQAIAGGQVERLLSSLFCHGDLFHLVFNCYSIHQVGAVYSYLNNPVEFLGMYLATGVAANLGTYVLGLSSLSIGASGCIFGLFGALLVELHYGDRRRQLTSIIDEEYVRNNLVLNLLHGLVSPNIDSAAHVLGFLSGATIKALLL